MRVQLGARRPASPASVAGKRAIFSVQIGGNPSSLETHTWRSIFAKDSFSCFRQRGGAARSAESHHGGAGKGAGVGGGRRGQADAESATPPAPARQSRWGRQRLRPAGGGWQRGGDGGAGQAALPRGRQGGHHPLEWDAGGWQDHPGEGLHSRLPWRRLGGCDLADVPPGQHLRGRRLYRAPHGLVPAEAGGRLEHSRHRGGSSRLRLPV
eukprot:scaffold1289_cov274-Pinguiococcus_pyrenoidosus.AAC.15